MSIEASELHTSDVGVDDLLDYGNDNLLLPTATSIRLLQISSSEAEDSLQCALTVEDLNNPELEPYSCLSYSWNCPVPLSWVANPLDWTNRCNVLTCNGQKLYITRSLAEALRGLSRGPVVDKLYRVWVDAISINQENIQERNSQVQLMHRIYRSAACTIAWLGPETDDVKDAVTITRELSTVVPQEEKFLSARTRHWSDEDAHTKLGISIVSEDGWKACAHLLERTWFRRVWAFQEAVISKTLVLLCGTVVVDWQGLWNLNEFMSSSGWYMHFPHSKWGTYGLGLPSTTVYYCRDKYQDHGPLPLQDMQALITQLVRQQHEAEDPRDIIYGLLGCGTDQLRNSIVPDYQKSTAEVYMETTRSLLRLSRSLQLLITVGDPDNRVESVLELPSWVPDYSRRPWPISLHPMYKYERFNAAADTTFTHDDQPSPDVLSLDGFCVGTVELSLPAELEQGPLMNLASLPLKEEETGGPQRTYWVPSREDHPYASRIQMLQTAANVAGLHIGIGETVTTVFWRTAMANTYFRTYPAPADMAKSFRARLLVSTADALASPNVTGELRSIMKSIISSLKEKDAYNELPDWSTIEDLAARMAYHYISPGTYAPEIGHSELFLEAMGYEDLIKQWWRMYVVRRCDQARSYLMLASRSVQPGDELWILAGSGTPFVLRRQDDGKHQLISESYVHGIMDGEAFVNGVPEMVRVELV